jgi:hypothetical protein
MLGREVEKCLEIVLSLRELLGGCSGTEDSFKTVVSREPADIAQEGKERMRAKEGLDLFILSGPFVMKFGCFHIHHLVCPSIQPHPAYKQGPLFSGLDPHVLLIYLADLPSLASEISYGNIP